VALFGVADLSVTQFTQDGAGNVTRMQGEGRNESSRLGLRGVEDIGGGWGAGFWFEAGVFYDSGAGQTTTSNNTSVGQNALSAGTNNSNALPDVVSLGGTQGLTFNRASVLSLMNKDLGELRLGRDYAPTFWNLTYFDPFGTVGVGGHTNVALGMLNVRPVVAPPGNPSPQVRASNSVGWLSNDISGFRVQLQMALSEQISNCTDLKTGGTVDAGGNLCQAPAGDGKYIGSRLQYNSGPLSLAAAYGKTNYGGAPVVSGTAPVTSTASAYVGDYKAMNLAGAYTIGATKLMAQYGKQTVGDYAVGYAAGTNTALTAGNGAWTNGAAAGAFTNGGIQSVTQRTVNHSLLGLTHAIGAWTLKASYSQAKMAGGQASNSGANAGAGVNKAIANIEDGAKQQMTAIGAVYDLSKRTAVYGTYSTLKTTGQNARSSLGIASSANLNLGDSVTATGLDIGVRHRF
jgi:predicted porin